MHGENRRSPSQPFPPLSCFNPLPVRCTGRTRNRGDTAGGAVGVSIRSPCDARGELRWRQRPRVEPEFQSAPRAMHGENPSAAVTHTNPTLFQSAPRAMHGENPGPWARISRRLQRFNPLPVRCTGRTARAFDEGRDSRNVSIRSPCDARGELQRPGDGDQLPRGFNPLPVRCTGRTRKAAARSGR